MHALAAEQSDAEAEEKRAGLRPWRMGAVGCMAAKAPGRARRKGSNGRDGLASCMATTRRKRKPHGQRRVAQCERFNCSCGKQSWSDVIPLLSFHMQTNGGCANAHAVDLIENRIQHNRPRKVVSVRRGGKEDEGLADEG